MKIDRLISEVKTTTKELIIITNKNTISSFFHNINNEFRDSSFSEFNKTQGDSKVQSVFRNGVTIHFIDQEDIDENIFASSIANAT